MEDYEPKLVERLGSALPVRLAALAKEFDGLLDRAALVLLLADEEGLIPQQASLDSGHAGAGAGATVEGLLERLSATRTFRRQDGATGFVCDADVRTPQGPRRVVLWDDAVRRIQPLRGQAVRLTRLQARGRSGESGEAPEWHSTRATEVLPGGAGVSDARATGTPPPPPPR